MRDTTETSRAEIVRKRRRQQTQKRLSESSALATRPLAPITTRAALAPTAPFRTASSRANRRYQAALSMPGVEVRMPAISFTGPQVKWRLLSFAVTLLLIGALYIGFTAPEFRVGVPRVQGDQRIGSDEIAAALGVTGSPIFTLVPADLEARLRLNFPELTSARVTVEAPNDVVVTVAERQPFIVWQQNGGYTWIDDGGVAFRPRGNAEGLIAVTALAAPPPGVAAENDPLSPLPYLSSDMVAAIRTLAPSAPQGTALIYDPRYGLGWSDSRGWQVFFGSDAGKMPLRLQVYQSLADMLINKRINPIFISVQYPSAPYYRMTQ